MINFRIHVNTRDVERRLGKLQEEFRDFRPLWASRIKPFIRNEYLKVFLSNGRGRWARTSRPNPILRDTRALIKSYTQEGARGSVLNETETSLEMGSEIEYAQYHETGVESRNLPPRPVAGLVVTRRGFSRDIERHFDEYISEILR